MAPVLEVKHLEKDYGKRGTITKAISGISFEVECGEYVGIMGASGSGKTTLLNCISTIDTPTAGEIIVDGNELTKLRASKLAKFRREELGFIFQDASLLDTLTGYENIALALTILKTPAKAIDPRVREVAGKLEISHVLDKFPYQMSGGERQRVAAARAIITEPSLVLADEPTGALDSKSAKMMLESFTKLNEGMGATILMVTHDSFAASFCKRILFIKDGKIFNEIVRGDDSRKAFFGRIIEVVTLLGGDSSDVL